jgi:hypothetical protein
VGLGNYFLLVRCRWLLTTWLSPVAVVEVLTQVVEVLVVIGHQPELLVVVQVRNLP